MNFHLSLFNSIQDHTPRAKVCAWAAFCQTLPRPAIRQDKDGLLFSAARYVGGTVHVHRTPTGERQCKEACRRIENVVELSMLVLEVDGAWQCDESSMLGKCGQRGPLVRFMNSRTGESRCPGCKVKGGKVSQVVFELEDLITAVRLGFPGNTFAIYSTHSHKSVTHSNPKAEPRFRIVVPLASPVPVANFLPLWLRAEAALTLPIDPQLKNPNGIYYTPVKAFEESVYEWFVEAGEFLQWERFQGTEGETGRRGDGENENRSGFENNANRHRNGDSTKHETGATAPAKTLQEMSLPPVLQTSQVKAQDKALPPANQTRNSKPETRNLFTTWPLRHEELCRRIVSRGRRNGSGIYDARCLAHGGKGTSALLYNPAKSTVHCNRGCTYNDILIAEGLPGGSLPDEPAGEARGQRLEASQGPISLAKLHVVNSLILAHCFELKDEDFEILARHWGLDRIYGEEPIQWPGGTDGETGRRGDGEKTHDSNNLCLDTDTLIRNGSASSNLPPASAHKSNATGNQREPVGSNQRPAGELRNEALVKVCSMPTFEQGMRAAARLNEHFDLQGVPGFYLTPRQDVWAMQLPRNLKPGALLAPYYSTSGYVIGIRIHRSWRDQSLMSPWLLTSRGLPGGRAAIRIQEAG